MKPRVRAEVNADERVVGWAADYQSLYVAASAGPGSSICKVDTDTGRTKLLRDISPLDKTGVIYIGPGHVRADGRY